MRTCAALSMVVLLGCASRASCPAGDLSLPPQTPAFVVVRSDYASSAIALLDADGTLIDADFVDSGTRVATLVQSVSGDVVVPSTALGLGRVAWLDRYGFDVLTIAEAQHPPAQIPVRGDVDGSASGASVNPWDAIALPDGRILVARYGINLDPGAPPMTRGNDLVVVEGGAVSERVELSGDAPVEASACTGARCTAYARPAVLLPLTVGSTLAVLTVLDRMTVDFQHAASGAVVTLDPATLAVSAPVVLDGLVNCAYASPDPTDPARAYVLCIGPRYAADGSHASEDDRRASAGIVEVTLDPSGTVSVTGRFQPTATDPVPSNGIVALGGGRVLYVASGSLDTTAPVSDRLVSLDVASGATDVVYRASTAFVLHDGCALGAGALVPDASANAILFVEGNVVTSRVTFDDCIGLPPIQIRPLTF